MCKGVAMEGMYAISEMAKMFELSRQTLIYYDRIDLFKPAMVNDKGYRYYSPTQIPFLRLICLLRDLGLELEEIKRLLYSCDTAQMTEHLRHRVHALDARITELMDERADVYERLGFYDDAVYWREREGVPTLAEYPERYVVFEPFPAGTMERVMLHPTLMRAIQRMQAEFGAHPMRGWGAMLRQEHFHGADPIKGAGSFAVLSGAVSAEKRDVVEVLPAGIYLCLSRWGMPYDPTGIRAAVACLDEHRLKPVGNAFDFCYLDTTSYNDAHREDFCCMQIPVAL